MDLDAWEQLPEEPARWFDRFERYRLAGPTRSLLPLYNAERKAENLPSAASVPGSWREAAESWSWRSRAEAWDQAERERRRAELAVEAAEDKLQRLQILKAARSKLLIALARLDPAAAKWGEVMNGIRLIAAELRAEYDDEPTQRMELDLPDMANATNEELQAIRDGLLPGPGRGRGGAGAP